MPTPLLAKLQRGHRLRNKAYHEWDRTTIEYADAMSHAECVCQLVMSCFGVQIDVSRSQKTKPPIAAFDELWKKLSYGLKRLNYKFEFTSREYLEPVHWLEEAADRGILPVGFLESYYAVLECRNRAADSPEAASRGDIIEHIGVLKRLIVDIERARKSP